MHFGKILLVCLGLVLVFGSACGSATSGNCSLKATILADGGAPLPPPLLVADGGAPLPPPTLVADGGAPLPLRRSWLTEERHCRLPPLVLCNYKLPHKATIRGEGKMF